MSGNLKLDIFIVGLMLIPIIIQFVPVVSGLFINSEKKTHFSVISFPPSIYIIFLSGFGNNLLGQVIVGLAFIVFFCTYAAALSYLVQANKVAK
ncbi:MULTISPECIES: hypothetical protein [Pseudoalteromonas]|uniref:hypothetical protein n=2 Tax=Pseudoalteromonas TaxID=53246 RepID=UPI00127F582D|nr:MULTISPECIES: hypothetical protein [Pseudoalteromonas]KAA8601638.1 hypothetical protein F0Z19_1365 [Vibrio cyclitrophicus]MBB1404454.1 hypothetical protein [Pseudoalteromonas sp. SG44-5]MBH0093317.1 hypothetical protein [Pseudoalteromonas sp. SCQQ13]MCQ8886171.1 hypothetical protein [Pseudoalteromonas agarivorans]